MAKMKSGHMGHVTHHQHTTSCIFLNKHVYPSPNLFLLSLPRAVAFL